MSALHLHQVTCTLQQRTAVDSVSLTVGAGEMLALIGPNGAGKTTLLKAIAQLLPYRGSVRWQGADLRALESRRRARRIAYLSQQQDWSWPVTVADLVALGRFPHRGHNSQARDDTAVQTALEQTGLLELAARPLSRLSGGERARALLARALAVEAEVLLADEPLTSLDPHHQLRALTLLREFCGRGGTAIVVLHDLTLASRFCDRLALLDRGALVAQGAVDSVLTRERLLQVYGVSALHGEHQQQRYVLPWQYHGRGPSDIDISAHGEDRDHDAVCL